MKNEVLCDFLINAGKTRLKILLAQCSEGQQLMFKRMYSQNVDEDINDVINNLPEHKINWTIQQAEKTLENNKNK